MFRGPLNTSTNALCERRSGCGHNNECNVVSLTGEILARAGRPFAVEPVRTLDALHLATIEALDDDPSQVSVVARDLRIVANARAMGCRVA